MTHVCFVAEICPQYGLIISSHVTADKAFRQDDIVLKKIDNKTAVGYKMFAFCTLYCYLSHHISFNIIYMATPWCCTFDIFW